MFKVRRPLLPRESGYLFTGRIDAARRAISTSPHVIQATFDSVIEDKRKSVIQYKDAIARLIVQHEAKMSKIKDAHRRGQPPRTAQGGRGREGPHRRRRR